MHRRKKPELLVPAGSIEPFIAAVENGADAIYIGGRLFNARMNAGNFGDEILPHALDYAHARGVKVFVTMNTLIYDEEMEEAMEYARFLYRVGADALIIQDLGLGARIHRELPNFPLHLSTQATSCDAESVRVAKESGYERVVLSRELSLPEIEEVCRDGGADIEVFVHGALCICYSGQCQMSRFYGGRSGNRGACAQPCRLPYEMTDASGKRKSGHLLSPKDLCLIDDLGRLIEAGVASFKIEGRMKSPEYVAVVTRIYRKYIDEYGSKEEYHVSPDDREELKQIFNRGGFTRGYLNGNPGRKLMSQVIPKNQGIRIGQVETARNTSTLVDVRCDIEPEMGDGIEIRSEKPEGKGAGPVASNIISYRKELGNGLYRIGDFREPVRNGSMVYRTSSKAQLEEARRSYRNVSIPENPENRHIGRRRDIVLTLSCYGGMLNLTAETVTEPDNPWESQRKQQVTVSAGPFEADFERATPEERYRGALGKTGNTPFRVQDIRMKGDFVICARASEINALRRECLQALEEKLRFRREVPEAERDSADSETHPCGTGVRQTTRASMKMPSADAIWVDGCTDKTPGNETQSVASEISDVQSIDWLPKSVHRIPLAQLCLDAEAEGIPLMAVLREMNLDRQSEPTEAEDTLQEQRLQGQVPQERGRFKQSEQPEPAMACAQEKENVGHGDNRILAISNVTKGKEDEILLRHWDEIRKVGRIYPILAGTLSWLTRLAEAGCHVYADYGLNTLNRETARVLASLGAKRIYPSLESLSREELEEEGNLPLMVSEHDFGEGIIRNSKRGICAQITHPEYSSQVRITPCKGNISHNTC